MNLLLEDFDVDSFPARFTRLLLASVMTLLVVGLAAAGARLVIGEKTLFPQFSLRRLLGIDCQFQFRTYRKTQEINGFDGGGCLIIQNWL